MNFQDYPVIDYSGYLVTDITKRIVVNKEIKNDPSVYQEYLIQDTETPEQLAHDFYGSVALTSLIFLMNDIVDPFFGWPMTETELQSFLAAKYTAPALTYDNILFTEDSNVVEFGNYTDWMEDIGQDLIGYKLTVFNGAAIGEYFITGVNFLGEVPSITVHQPLPVTDVYYSGWQISNGNIDEWHHWELNGLPVPPVTPGAVPVTMAEFERNENEKKRKIKIIRPAYVQQVIREMKSVLESGIA